MQTPEPSTLFVDHLRERLHQQKPKPIFHKINFRPVWIVISAVLLVIILSTIIIGPQKVWAAFRGLFGYLPGIGLVEEGSNLRLLEKPIEVSRDGITLTVENAAFDGNRLILVYKTEGLNLEAANSQGEIAPVGGVAVVVLPDGAVITQSEGSLVGWATGYRARLVFSGLPPETVYITLFIHRLETMPEGAAPQDWQISVPLEQAPAEITILPVYELPSPTPVVETPAAGLNSQGNSTQVDGVQFVLDKVIETETGFRFQGYVSWHDHPEISYVTAIPSAIRSGETLIAFEMVDPDLPVGGWEDARSDWAIQTNSKAFSGAVSIQFDDIIIHEKAEISFPLDLGISPEPGRLLHPNIPLTVNGKSAVLTSAELESTSDGMIDLNLHFVADPSILSIGFYDEENYVDESPTGGGGGGGGSVSLEPPANILSSFRYASLPYGTRELTIIDVSRISSTAVSLVWQAPDLAARENNPAQPQMPSPVCLTDTIWKGLDWNQPIALPENLSGTLLMEQFVNGQPMPLIYLANLDGSNRREIDYGAWSSLSSDGKKIAYIRSEGPGIVLYDDEEGSAQVIPGTIPEDWNPIWSPDGEWIVFKRGVGGTYYRIHSDGSGLEKIFETSSYLDFSSFDPDGKSIIAQGLTDKGVMVQRIDLEKKRISDLFPTGMVKTVAFPLIAPDGKWVLYRGKDFAVPTFSIKVARIDGSDIRTIAETPSLNTLLGAWSPDGKWILITVQTENGDYVFRSVLINVINCSVYPLNNLPGQVKGWVSALP